MEDIASEDRSENVVETNDAIVHAFRLSAPARK
jgi:hypothetical protein